MSKSYLFTLNKYYNDEEIENVSPIIENYVNLFADENGTAKLQLRDDVTVVIKRDEGLALHMVLDNPDNFTALPKKLTKAKNFLQVFITKMAEAVDEKRKADASAADAKAKAVADAKAKVETEAENSLLGYIGAGNAPAETPETPTETTTVKVNGEEITDPAEKQKVIDELTEKQKELTERATKIFAETFNKVIKSFKDSGIDWLRDYLD